MVVVKHLFMTMDDGVRLCYDLYTSAELVDGAGEPRPVVLDYIPYRKDEVEVGGWGAWYYADLVRSGYSVARVDIRGTGSSEGIAIDEYSDDELMDGYTAVEFLARQDWCNGHVCMTGISYGGFTSLLVAGRQPPSLTAIAPMYAGHDRYAAGDHYRGGLLGMWFDLGYYGLYLAAFNLLPPDRTLEGWREIWLRRLASNQPYLLRWLRNQRDGPFWRGGSVSEITERIRCPVLLIGGWRDAYPSSPLYLYERLRVPKRLIVGPWNHAVPDIAIPGPRIDYVREIVGWFDRWCGRTKDGQESAPVAVFMQSWMRPDRRRVDAAGRWRSEATWPPSGHTCVQLYLGGAGCLAEGPREGIDMLRYEPEVGTAAGLFCYMSFGQSEDQRRDEGLSLTYTSDFLHEPLPVLGSPYVDVRISCPMRIAALGATISDVAPDGQSMLVTKGLLNLTRRKSLRDPEPMESDMSMDIRIGIDATGWIFMRGHRVRLRLACSEWPNFWPTPELGVLTVDRSHSVLHLPVVPIKSALKPPAFAAAVTDDLEAAPLPDQWLISRELGTGAMRYEIDFGRDYPADFGETHVRRRFNFTATLDPSNPASACAHGRHLSEISWRDGAVSAVADVTARASRSHIDVDIAVEVTENGGPSQRRRWMEHIPRDLL